MSLEKEIREKLIAEAADYKKLDQLVRQGMMSPAQLPMLHRGLDKMQSGKVLNPQEREAVNKVMQSMMYIVTGDSTVFQKAKQHTQKNRYQTEEVVVEDISKMSDSRLKFHATKGVPHGSYSKQEIKDEHNERKQTKTYQAARPSMNEEEIEEGSAAEKLKANLKKKGVDLDQRAKDRKAEHEKLKAQYGQEEVEEGYIGAQGEKGRDYHNAGTFSKPEAYSHAKKNKGVVHKDASGKYLVKHGRGANVSEESLDEYGYMAASAKDGYKAKFDAMLKKTGKSLKDMSDEEKKAFFNKVDGAHKAKDESVDEAIKSGYGNVGSDKYKETLKKSITDLKKKPAKKEVEEGAMSRMATQASEKERLGAKKVKGTGLETFKKKPADKFPHNTSATQGKRMGGKSTIQASYSEDATHVVKYTDSKGKHVNSSKAMSADKAKAHAMKGNKMDKVGGNYKVHSVSEDMASDSEEMRVKTQRKLKRMSNMKAKQEKETDAGYKAAVKEDAAADARRHARADSKGLATTKKDAKDDGEHKGKKAGDESHGGHIVMQLRKAVTINKPVKFKDGSSHNISKGDAHKYMSKYMTAKPADKEKMHSAHDSHDSFQKHINS
ncbi:hypothetical protein [Alteromonas sp.]|uniref:hypothetical protein n=1 Tax=Alteromonas sp. TaxID=232 RepID=UPI000B766190|nr:hypothetical protein [Alteromonas sp.]MAI39411.1 hypothetical protein [Alteromonas sp.]|tara:strand:- start:723 stop:2543 length:1821 start_codon:yes stop_codon:yes gene_type:complete